MNGRAPNSPATGSQVDVRQKPRPNFWIERPSTGATARNRSPTTIRIRASPKAPVADTEPEVPGISRVACRSDLPVLASTPDVSRPRSCRAPPVSSFTTVGRQRRVAELRGELLPVGQRPFHEVHHGLRLRLVHGVLVEQQPRERRDGVGALDPAALVIDTRKSAGICGRGRRGRGGHRLDRRASRTRRSHSAPDRSSILFCSA